MIDNRLKRSTLIIGLALTLLLLPAAFTKAYASRIVAIVNGAVITDFDVSQRQRLERLLSGGKRRLGKSAALNALIDEKLKLIEARDRKRSTSDAEVDRAIGNMARNAKMTSKRMLGVFKQAGVNRETVKNWLKAQIAWRNLIRARFNAQVRVEEAEIMQVLNKNSASKDKVESTIQYDLTSVNFIVPSKSSKSAQNQKLREAKRFRANFQSCDKDLKAARRLSDVAVTRVGRRQSNTLPPVFAKSLKDTPVNRLTAPRKTDTGYEMLAVCGKKDLGKQITMRDEIETKLKDERSRSLSRKYLGELRARAVIEKR